MQTPKLLATYGQIQFNALAAKVGGKVPSPAQDLPKLLSTYGSVKHNHLSAKVGNAKVNINKN